MSIVKIYYNILETEVDRIDEIIDVANSKKLESSVQKTTATIKAHDLEFPVIEFSFVICGYSDGIRILQDY